MTLVLDGLVKNYEGFSLGPLSFSIEDDVLSVLGPSGCGKTTLLETIAGITEPDAGTIVLDDRELTSQPPHTRGTVLVFQDGALFPHLTARENVAYAAATPERVDELAATLEIEGILDQRADTLSGGERQRVAVARSLAADPEVLLLDEPLANLDTPIKRRLGAELRTLLASLSIPVVYVTHDQRQAAVVGDRIAVLDDGTLHQLDTPPRVFHRPATPFVASFTGSVNLFRATVAEIDGRLRLEWGDRSLVASMGELDVGDRVWFCLRPEYVAVLDADDSDDAGDVGNAHDADRENVLEASVVDRVFEGDASLVALALDGNDVIRAKLLAPTDDRLAVAEGDRVRIALPPEAIHVGREQ